MDVKRAGREWLGRRAGISAAWMPKQGWSWAFPVLKSIQSGSLNAISQRIRSIISTIISDLENSSKCYIEEPVSQTFRVLLGSWLPSKDLPRYRRVAATGELFKKRLGKWGKLSSVLGAETGFPSNLAQDSTPLVEQAGPPTKISICLDNSSPHCLIAFSSYIELSADTFAVLAQRTLLASLGGAPGLNAHPKLNAPIAKRISIVPQNDVGLPENGGANCLSS
ncbi:hypothetical protein K469DRAFT_778238 [Zopfia rhizophila CBS 207.26]|uniref:Uncharacterized protein n=1 Tax=Zopfia rhizophila CBS 207.26 TaxID=1314779 RepID=A0A6A6E2M4_9PEZI|nr:hypothetical protein K469DRAFT_778238 [Zopfia rhizophila CBS 207.26]